MIVHVRYSAQARHAAGTAAESVELPDGAIVRELLEALVGRHGPRLGDLIFGPSPRPQPAVLVFVEQVQVDWSHPPPLKEGDNIMILSPISGG